jgi:hypothetical protein
MLNLYRRAREGRRIDEGNASHRGFEKRESGERGVQIIAVSIHSLGLTMGNYLLA